MFDNEKISIRPKLDYLENSVDDNLVIQFQNKTLRPILKLQNDLLIELVKPQLPKLSNIKDEKERRIYLQNFFNNNPLVNQLFMGTVIGLFTIDEVSFYLSNTNEVNKRVKNMIIERLASQFFNS